MLLSLAWLPFLSPAQAPYFHTYTIDRLKTNERINCMIQGTDQLIRIGTSQGLFTFDGLYFTPVPMVEQGTEISALYEDANGKLWYGTDGGKIGFQDGDSALTWEKFESAGNAGRITAIAEDINHILWIATYGNGLFYLDGDSIKHLPAGPDLPDPFIYTMLVNRSGRIMTGSDAGIQIIDRKQDGSIHTEVITASNGLPDNMVHALALHPDGSVWVGTHSRGLVLFNPETGKFHIPAIAKDWKFETISSLLPLHNEVWAGTKRHGIINLGFGDEESLQQYNENNAFSSNSIHTMFQDLEGNIWVAGSGNTLSRTNRRFTFITSHEGASFGNILAITGDRSGNIWFSNQSGLYSHNHVFNGNYTMRKHLQNTPYEKYVIISLKEDNQGYIWAGTFDHGVLRIDPETGEVLPINHNNGLVNNNVLSIETNKNQIWLATLGGVSRLLPVRENTYEISNFGKADGLGNSYVFDIKRDRKGRIWFATDGSGLSMFDGSRFHNFSAEMDSLSQVVYAIVEDKKGLIWFCTPSNGLYTYNGKSFQKFDMPGPGVNKQMIGLAVDSKGDVVSVSSHSIDVIDSDNHRMTSYGQAFGIHAINPQFKAVTADYKGNIWIGGEKSTILLTVSEGDRITGPQTLVTGVDLLLEPLTLASHYTFNHKQNHLTFHFAGLWYQNPEAVHYRYRLEGYDRNWITSGDRKATYSSLPPGKYRFKVQSTHTSHFGNASERVIEIEIRPPFWATTWFIIVAALALITALLLVVRERERRLNKYERDQREKLAFQLETLRSQVNPHFLFNSFNTLLYLIDEDKDSSIKYVENLSGFFRDILQYRDQNLINLKEEITLSENYLYLQKQRYNNNLTIQMQVPDDVMSSLIPPLTLQLLFENALKHNVVSKANPLQITVVVNNDYLRICNNLQPKYSAEAGTGLGLENIRKRFSLLTDLPVTVEKNDVLFCVGVPLLKEK